MRNYIILPFIERIQKQDMTVFNEIYDVFKGLIIYYSRRLGYEDAQQELTVFLLELLYALDTELFVIDPSFSVKKYIAVAIRNRYIALSRKNQLYITMCDELFEKSASITPDFDGGISLSAGLDLLSERQRQVVVCKYIDGYSDAEISEFLKISRQAVNRLKNRALTVLKEYYI